MRNRLLLPTAALACITLASVCFANSLHYAFLEWDDPFYILQDPFIQHYSFNNLVNILTEPFHAAWYPLTRLSHAIDLWVFGDNAFYHRLVSLALHTTNGILVYGTASQLIRLRYPHASTGPVFIAALLAALLFVAHPQHVEVVVWVTQRNELLATLFFMSTLLAYSHYLENHQRSTLAWAVFFSLLALIAKPTAIGIPVVLFVFDMIFREELQRRDKLFFRQAARALLEKIPFVLVSVVISVVTMNVNKTAYALKLHDIYNTTQRLCYAAYNMLDFIYRFLIPIDLTPIVAFPGWIRILSPLAYFPLLAILLISILAILKARQPRTCWLLLFFAYIALILPTSGFMMFGTYSAANRYMYMPSALLITCVGLLIYKPIMAGKKSRGVTTIPITLLLCIYSYLTINQVTHWRDDTSLWRYVIQEQPAAATAQVNYASLLAAQGKITPRQAIAILEAAVTIEPVYIGLDNLLKMYAAVGDEEKWLYTHARISHFYPAYSGTSRAIIGIHLLAANNTEAGERLVLDGIRKNPSLCSELEEQRQSLASIVAVKIDDELQGILEKARSEKLCQ